MPPADASPSLDRRNASVRAGFCAIVASPSRSVRPEEIAVGRDAPLKQLPGATRFSDDPDLRDAVEIVRYVRAHPKILTALREGFGCAYDPLSADDAPELWEVDPTTGRINRRGRPRAEGDWPLLFLAYVLSRVNSVQAFVHLHRHSILEFPRFRGHLIAGPSGPAARIDVHAVNPAVFA